MIALEYNKLGVIKLEAAERAIEIIRNLPADKLKAALYFLEYLAMKEELEATEDILADEKMMASIREADKARKEGRWDEFVPLEALDDV